METALKAFLKSWFADYVDGLDNLNEIRFNKPITLHNLKLNAGAINKEMEENEASCPITINSGTIGELHFESSFFGGMKVVADKVELSFNLNPLKAMKNALTPEEAEEEDVRMGPGPHQQHPPPHVQYVPIKNNPAVFCPKHDASEKRVKAEPAMRTCVNCKQGLQTNYQDFAYCPGCSATHRKCMICGDDAPHAASPPPPSAAVGGQHGEQGRHGQGQQPAGQGQQYRGHPGDFGGAPKNSYEEPQLALPPPPPPPEPARSQAAGAWGSAPPPPPPPPPSYEGMTNHGTRAGGYGPPPPGGTPRVPAGQERHYQSNNFGTQFGGGTQQQWPPQQQQATQLPGLEPAGNYGGFADPLATRPGGGTQQQQWPPHGGPEAANRGFNGGANGGHPGFAGEGGFGGRGGFSQQNEGRFVDAVTAPNNGFCGAGYSNDLTRKNEFAAHEASTPLVAAQAVLLAVRDYIMPNGAASLPKMNMAVASR